MLNIHSIETFGTQEGPGIRVVIFTQGCLMKCLYCHNPDTIEFKENKMMSQDEILKIAEKVKPYFGKKGGLTFSGGECLTQAENLLPVVKLLKQNGFHICIDTNGFVFNEHVKEVLKYVDLVLLDIKHFYEQDHKKLTGVSNINVLKFGDYLEKNDIKFWIRHVLVPTITDDEKHLLDLSNHFKDFKNLERLEILPYHTLGVHKWRELGMKYELDHIASPTNDEVLRVKHILEQNLKEVYVRR